MTTALIPFLAGVLGCAIFFGLRWFVMATRALRTDHDNALMLITSLEKSMLGTIHEISSINAARYDSLKQAVSTLEGIAADIESRLSVLEPNRQLIDKTNKEEEQVQQFRGAIGFRKFMEQGIN